MSETTIFRDLLGNSPVIRVLDFLIEGRGLDYSLTDIAENSNVGRTALQRIRDNLVRTEMVVFTRSIGKAKLCRLNEKNPSAKQLIKLYDTLLFQETERHLSGKARALKA